MGRQGLLRFLEKVRGGFEVLNKGLEEKNRVLFREFVPMSGPADTIAGELIRAVNRIGYRYYNDGDHIGVGYGNETCNSAARYILEIFDGTEMAKIVRAIWGLYSDDRYERGVEALTDAMIRYLYDHPALMESENHCDMLDFRDSDDEDWEDEEDEYDPFEEPWAVYDPE